MQFDSTQVRCFLAAVGTRSWTQAAQQLSLSPPLVREQVSALERNLDVPLWEVEEPVLTPTREGEALAALFREMSDRLEGLLASLRARAQGGPARLTVGVYDGADQAGLLQSIGRDLGCAGPQSVPAFSGGSALQLCQGFRSGRYDALLFPREIAESLSRIGLLSRTRTAEVGTLRTCLYCAGASHSGAISGADSLLSGPLPVPARCGRPPRPADPVRPLPCAAVCGRGGSPGCRAAHRGRLRCAGRGLSPGRL